ncbi:hypothetical protein ACCC92_03310 [Mucilaginibacter sp. Mucisp84]|uniref:hypothetical protein n=1 Tax=Mucilaginibacter sp. Mucisp84 TaxID=3243058 RepID=UPI0039A483CD
MLQFDFNISLNDKTHIDLLTGTIKNHHIGKPVFIIEYEDSYQLMFESDYEQYELIKEFAAHFDDYEYTEDISGGNDEILMAVRRVQSPFSSDNFGRRWNEDPIEKNFYLVKIKDALPAQKPQSVIHVLFGKEIREYKIHVGEAVNRNTKEEGYIVIKEIPQEGEKPEFLTGLFLNAADAFWEGYRLLTPRVEADYEDFQKELKRSKKTKAKK